MSKRREFTKDVYAQIVRRAMLPTGQIACEGCGLVLNKKVYHIDHTIPDGLQIDKSRKLTADDGKLLGVECCHKPKTAKDKGDIAKAKRVEANYLGFKGPTKKFPSRGFAKSEKAERQLTKAQLPYRQLYKEIDHDHQ